LLAIIVKEEEEEREQNVDVIWSMYFRNILHIITITVYWKCFLILCQLDT